MTNRRRDGLLNLSELLIANHELSCFADLVEAVRIGARTERFLRMDVRPPFPDTPANWEDVLESAFNAVIEDAR